MLKEDLQFGAFGIKYRRICKSICASKSFYRNLLSYLWNNFALINK